MHKKLILFLFVLLFSVLLTNGQPAQAQVIDTCVLDMFFMLDESGSISSSQFNQEKAFIVNVFNVLPIEEDQTKVGLGFFASTAQVVRALTFDKAQLINDVNTRLQRTGTTSLIQAINVGQSRLTGALTRFSVQKVLVVVTDGNASDGTISQVAAAANAARSAGTIVYALGIGTSVSQPTLLAIAGDASLVFQATSFDDLDPFVTSLTNNACGSPAEITGKVFIDVNENGVQDAGESNAPNVTMNLTGAGGLTPVQTVSTDANGDYMFQVAAGTYRVQLVPPANNPIATGIDFNPANNNLTAQITVLTSQTVANVDGNLKPRLWCAFPGGTRNRNQTLPTANVTLLNTDNTLVPFTGKATAMTFNPAVAVAGTTAKNTSSGAAAYNDLSIDAPGTYSLTATSPGLNNASCGDITIVNRPPNAVDDAYSTDEDVTLTIPTVADPDLLDNDSDPDGDALTVVSNTAPTLGNVTVNANGSFEYVPNPDVNGVDSFDYTIEDIYGAQDTATVTITVNAVNDPPTINADAPSVTVDEADLATNTGTFGDIDSAAVALASSIGVVSDTGGGTWAWEFLTSDGPPDSQVVTVTADDGEFTVPVTFSLTVLNVSPTITLVDHLPAVPEAVSVTVTVTATDPAGINDPLEYEFDCDNDGVYETGPQSSNASECLYMDDGIYVINVRVNDGDGGSDTASTTVLVLNAPPVVDPIDNQYLTIPDALVHAGLELTVDFSDTPADTHTATVDFGEGDGPQATPIVGNTVQVGVHHFSPPLQDEYTVTVCVLDDDGGESCQSFTVFIEPGPPEDRGNHPNEAVHVSDIDGDAATRGNGWQALVVVRIKDSNGQPYLGQLNIFGEWQAEDGTVLDVIVRPTSTGSVAFLRNLRQNSWVTFVVTDVQGATYDPASNSDPDGDSTGTAITILSP